MMFLMIRRVKVLSLSLMVMAISVLPCFTASAIEPGNSIVGFSQKDMPEYCKLPVSVPNNLTSKEYFDLAADYADSKLPIHARQCLDKLEKMSLDKQMKLKIDRLVDTRLPKQLPTVEAVLLNLQARKVPPLTKKNNWQICQTKQDSIK